ncbi:MAG: hypothetical protein PHG27_07595 [Massilibacteroides sp.]|nr:hypothetical protein [Massilibacteroides sp.]MDD4115441.1 hypothetical protein [Massilibacteroides sp.]MDD4659875.1 hypothetical protein [Massilibacteroides sp.]
MKNNRQQTPLEILTAEKKRIRQLAKEREVKINEHVAYMQANAGNLFLSFLSSMLFSSSSDKEEHVQTSTSGDRPTDVLTTAFSFADLLPLIKIFIPIAWNVVKPILVSWSIKKAGSFIAGLFAPKKVQPIK